MNPTTSWVLLGATGGLIIGMGVAVMIARHFLVLGWEQSRDDSVLTPRGNVGRLPKGRMPAKHRQGVRRAEDIEDTSTLVPVRDGYLFTHGDTGPLRVKPEWPEDMPDDERQWINEDSRRADTVDAADRGEHQ